MENRRGINRRGVNQIMMGSINDLINRRGVNQIMMGGINDLINTHNSVLEVSCMI